VSSFWGTFQNNIFSIDLDFVDFDDFTYNIAEIEIMVENEKDIDDAVKKINNFAKENNFKIDSVREK
jgi:adenylate cyclase class IV